MLHAEAEHGRAVVVTDFLFLGVEAHALPDNGGFRAGTAPDGKGHLEAHGQDTLVRFAGAVAESVSVGGEDNDSVSGRGRDLLARELVGGGGAFMFGRDVAEVLLDDVKSCMSLKTVPSHIWEGISANVSEGTSHLLKPCISNRWALAAPTFYVSR